MKKPPSDRDENGGKGYALAMRGNEGFNVHQRHIKDGVDKCDVKYFDDSCLVPFAS